MSEWRPYLGDRLIKDHPSGFVVIVPTQSEACVPLFCPVCRLLMQTSEDAIYFRDKQCCSKCGMKWADPDLDSWFAGVRPSCDEVGKEVKIRQSLPVV